MHVHSQSQQISPTLTTKDGDDTVYTVQGISFKVPNFLVASSRCLEFRRIADVYPASDYYFLIKANQEDSFRLDTAVYLGITASLVDLETRYKDLVRKLHSDDHIPLKDKLLFQMKFPDSVDIFNASALRERLDSMCTQEGAYSRFQKLYQFVGNREREELKNLRASRGFTKCAPRAPKSFSQQKVSKYKLIALDQAHTTFGDKCTTPQQLGRALLRLGQPECQRLGQILVHSGAEGLNQASKGALTRLYKSVEPILLELFTDPVDIFQEMPDETPPTVRREDEDSQETQEDPGIPLPRDFCREAAERQWGSSAQPVADDEESDSPILGAAYTDRFQQRTVPPLALPPPASAAAAAPAPAAAAAPQPLPPPPAPAAAAAVLPRATRSAYDLLETHDEQNLELGPGTPLEPEACKRARLEKERAVLIREYLDVKARLQAAMDRQ